MPVDKATRDSLRTYALAARTSYTGDATIGAKVLVELINDLNAAEARARRLREAIEPYTEMRCAYIDSISVACPGILVDGFPCMSCAIRAALAPQEEPR